MMISELRRVFSLEELLDDLFAWAVLGFWALLAMFCGWVLGTDWFKTFVVLALFGAYRVAVRSIINPSIPQPQQPLR